LEKDTEPDSVAGSEGTELSQPDVTDADLLEYRARLNTMAEMAMSAQSGNAPAPPTTPKPDPTPEDVMGSFNVSQEEYDAAASSPEGMAKLLARVQAAARVAVLREIPKLVERQVTEQVSLRSAVDSFYSENKDLVPYKSVVAYKVRELEKANPDWTYDNIFKVLAKEVRTYLRLPSGPKVSKHNDNSPAFPSTKSSRKLPTADTRTPLQKELDELSPRR